MAGIVLLLTSKGTTTMNTSDEFVSIRLDRLLAGSALVPPDRRAEFLAIIVAGPEALLSEVDVTDVIADDLIDHGEESGSYPIGVKQCLELADKIDEHTWRLLRAVASNPNGIITWGECRAITKCPNDWNHFVKRLGGLHRAMRRLRGVPSTAVLLWANDEGWGDEDGPSYPDSGQLQIDGQALLNLRIACGLPEGVNFTVGDRVKGLWLDDGKLYPATIVELRPGEAKLKFDHKSKPEWGEIKHVHPLSAEAE
jgi:hypothetical protein